MSLCLSVRISVALSSLASAYSLQQLLTCCCQPWQTTEVIRAYAAVNDAFPKSLEDLEPLPALLNPRTGKHFGYAVKKDDQGKEYAVLSADDHESLHQNRIVQIHLRGE